MSKFHFYAVFYLNLMYSSIPVENRKKVIKKCYWPLLELANKGVPLGIQITGITLEIINKLDPIWVKRFKQYLLNKKCELIGSGYSQIIGPLVPAKVNHYNQILGLDTYKNILGITPKIAAINEMAYSSGVVESFLDNGYQTIIMEWNNPRRYHPEWKDEWRYYRQDAIGADGRLIHLIWIDTIAFQKFQRYVHGELNFNEYAQYLFNHEKRSSDGYLCLYDSDAEIFDFRAGRFYSEAALNKEGEWKKINQLFDYLKKNKKFKLLLPSEIVDLPPSKFSDKKLRLECPQQPIPVKKQEKYNLYRWALTGRNDIEINTKCYRIYKFLEENKSENHKDWKELCYLWSSDFRTHITKNRWSQYLKRLDKFFKGKVKPKRILPLKSKQIIRLPYQNKLFQCWEDKRYLIIESNSVKCIFDKLKGLSINSFWFKNKSKKPLFGMLPLGYYDDISFGADFYSGHMVIERPGKRKITDLMACAPEILISNESSLIVRVGLENGGVSFKKEYHIDFKKPCLEIRAEIYTPKREVGIIRGGNITFIPTSFDKNSLFFTTNNGGQKMENFKIGNKTIYHTQSPSCLISAKQGLGATEGVLVIGDNKKTINIYHNQAVSAIIPSIHYHPVDNNLYFFRVQYSAQEMDETFRESKEKQTLRFYWKIE